MNYVEKSVVEVLKKYYETDSKGNPNKEFNPNFSAQEALDEICQIVKM